MKLSETRQRELALRLAQGVIKATSCGFEVTRQGYSHWAISHEQKDEIRMCAKFLAEQLAGETGAARGHEEEKMKVDFQSTNRWLKKVFEEHEL